MNYVYCYRSLLERSNQSCFFPVVFKDPIVHFCEWNTNLPKGRRLKKVVLLVERSAKGLRKQNYKYDKCKNMQTLYKYVKI